MQRALPDRPDAATRRPSAARVAAWLGILVSLLLIPATLVGYANVSGQVAEAADTVDERLALGISLVDTASQGVDVLATAAGTIGQTADEAASDAGLLGGVFDQIASFSDDFQAFQESYHEAADAAGDVAERVESFSAVLPGDVAPDLGDAVGTLEARVAQLEDAVGELLDQPAVGVVVEVTGIADLARRVETAMVGLGEGLETVSANLARTRDAVNVRSGEIAAGLTVLAAAIGAWLVYTAVLNVALLRVLPDRRQRPR